MQMLTETVKQETLYQQAFRELQQAANVPAWLKRLRSNAMDVFGQLGFPSVREEDWKYTNVAPIARSAFRPSTLLRYSDTPIPSSSINSLLYPEAVHSQLVFVNGRLRADLSNLTGLHDSVWISELRRAMLEEKTAEIVREHLARGADYVRNGFTALNTAFISDGALVVLPRDHQIQAPISLVFLTDGAEANSVTFPRVLIVADENSNATIIESYAGVGGQPYFTDAVVEVVMKDGSRLTHYKIQRESIDAYHVATTTVSLGGNCSYDATSIMFGAEISRHDIAVTMEHEGAECWIDGLYTVGDGQHVDTHSVIDHRTPHCTSHQLYKGILAGKSRAVFNGRIFVRHGAQKTDALQTNKNLLLSNEARVDTKPQLEILADDVKCAHGAAVGQIDEEELFYLRSRGLDAVLARNLLTYGFAEEVIAKIEVGSLKTQLEEAVLNTLHASI